VKLTDKELDEYARLKDGMIIVDRDEWLSIVCELRAARDVLRAVKRIPVCLDFPEIYRAICAYDKARKGKAT
jgi:hypothetical protein